MQGRIEAAFVDRQAAIGLRGNAQFSQAAQRAGRALGGAAQRAAHAVDDGTGGEVALQSTGFLRLGIVFGELVRHPGEAVKRLHKILDGGAHRVRVVAHGDRNGALGGLAQGEFDAIDDVLDRVAGAGQAQAVNAEAGVLPLRALAQVGGAGIEGQARQALGIGVVAVLIRDLNFDGVGRAGLPGAEQQANALALFDDGGGHADVGLVDSVAHPLQRVVTAVDVEGRGGAIRVDAKLLDRLRGRAGRANPQRAEADGESALAERVRRLVEAPRSQRLRGGQALHADLEVAGGGRGAGFHRQRLGVAALRRALLKGIGVGQRLDAGAQPAERTLQGAKRGELAGQARIPLQQALFRRCALSLHQPVNQRVDIQPRTYACRPHHIGVTPASARSLCVSRVAPRASERLNLCGRAGYPESPRRARARRAVRR